MTPTPATPPPPERRQLVRFRGRFRRPQGRLSRQLVAAGLLDRQHIRLGWSKTHRPQPTIPQTQGEPMNPIMTPDYDDNRPATLEMCLIPQIPKDLTVEQADALLAQIWASGLPDAAKSRLAQQVDYRLAEAAGKGQQPRAVVAGVFFTGADPDEVMRQRKALAAQR